MTLRRNGTNHGPWLRRSRFLARLIAGACAGLVLILCVLAASPQAHHWLHHDSDDKDHDCAVVVFAHGLTVAGDEVRAEAILLCLVAGLTVRYLGPDLSAPRYALQPERGPPVA